MSTEENKAIVRRFFKAFAANDQATLKEVLAPALVAYLPGVPDPLNLEAFLAVVGRWNMAFSDLDFAIEEQIAEGDKVAARLTVRGVHSRGDFLDVPPSGKHMAISIVTIERITSSQIVERRVIFDLLALMQQLGATPTSRADS